MTVLCLLCSYDYHGGNEGELGVVVVVGVVWVVFGEGRRYGGNAQKGLVRESSSRQREEEEEEEKRHKYTFTQREENKNGEQKKHNTRT